jgi:hypothetical protein
MQVFKGDSPQLISFIARKPNQLATPNDMPLTVAGYSNVTRNYAGVEYGPDIAYFAIPSGIGAKLSSGSTARMTITNVSGVGRFVCAMSLPQAGVSGACKLWVTIDGVEYAFSKTGVAHRLFIGQFSGENLPSINGVKIPNYGEILQLQHVPFSTSLKVETQVDSAVGGTVSQALAIYTLDGRTL